MTIWPAQNDIDLKISEKTYFFDSDFYRRSLQIACQMCPIDLKNYSRKIPKDQGSIFRAGYGVLLI